ncbi:nucleoside hydrolase [Peribacillus muralis]|uniref:nucleoside hydrolase n=1 Tax=Peribacillus muralis TaxID=264697 RepID=UPI001F4D5EBF|nr:nucleoside hydrolase [Peribacillus muralis]MCK1994968.1 nucleoside hydrolase [Peribacillus muralis]MCK2015486.1 nucleoside hydrolase [Peribacillus muralis]
MKPIIFDVDTGIDDALAMAYALHSPELEVLGFTTCFGNVAVEDATRNTLAVLEQLNQHIPVYSGANQTLKRGEKKKYPKHVHGEDGLGNTLKGQPSLQAAHESAVDFIINQVKSRPQEITVIAVGPLTNIALAIKKSPEIMSLVKEVIIMGGAVKVPGNVNPFAEANIISDPDAADLVLSSKLPVTLVGLDVTMKTCLPKSKLDDWRATGMESAQFFAKMTDHYMKAYDSSHPGLGGCALHDPLAVGVAIDSGFVSTELMDVKVVTEGEETGRTIGEPDRKSSIRVCTEVDANRFVKHFLDRVIRS